MPQELSLRRFVEQLKASAAAKALGERENHGELPWARLSHETCAEGRLDEPPLAAEEPKPLLIAVVQRTRNRRIININALINRAPLDSDEFTELKAAYLANWPNAVGNLAAQLKGDFFGGASPLYADL